MRDESKYRPLRERAKKMLLIDHLSESEVAEILGVAQKTVSTWYRTYGWHRERKKQQEESGSANSLCDFIEFVRTESPANLPIVETLFKDFLKAH